MNTLKKYAIPVGIVLVVLFAWYFSGKTHAGDLSAHPYYQKIEQAHKEMMNMSPGMDMGAKNEPEKVIAVFLYDDFALLDATGPIQALSGLHGYKVVTVAKKKGLVNSSEQVKVEAQYGFADAPKDIAVLVVPGGLFGTLATAKDAETLEWIRKVDERTTYTTSVCTGAWILASADVLKGHRASTHWTSGEYLEKLGAKYTGERYTLDGKYLTAAGVSGGIDMALKLADLLEGPDASKAQQLMMEYDPQPPYDAGSPQKADPMLVEMMQKMSDEHIQMAEMMH